VLNDLFVQLDSNSFVMCHVQIFEQIRCMGGWFELLLSPTKFARFIMDVSSLLAYNLEIETDALPVHCRDVRG